MDSDGTDLNYSRARRNNVRRSSEDSPDESMGRQEGLAYGSTALRSRYFLNDFLIDHGGNVTRQCLRCVRDRNT